MLTWFSTMSNHNGWQLPEVGEPIIIRVGNSFYSAYLDKDDEDTWFQVEMPISDFSYTLDEVHSWCYISHPELPIRKHGGYTLDNRG